MVRDLRSTQSGQAILEAILVLTLFLAVTTLITREFKKNELFSSMVASPWQRLSGMIQNGVWLPPKDSNGLHPSNLGRHVSVKGDKPQ